MADVLVPNIPESVLEALKRRAEEHRRSLQGELLTILEAAVAEPSRQAAFDAADRIRAHLAQSGRTFTDSTPLVREDRER